MSIPANNLYTKSHEWGRKEADGNIRVGISDFAQHALGDVVYVELPEVGTEVTQGEGFGTVESTKSTSDLNAPMSGKIVAVNSALESQPELVNSDPYGEGWMILIEPSDAAEAENLLNPAAYETHSAAEAH